jgi:signal peptidase I
MILSLEQCRCDLAAEALRRSGTLTLKAFGTSMLPTLWPGDLARVQSCGFDDVHAGDIVLCKRHDRFYLHRVAQKIGNGSLITRGDSMPGADPRLPSEDLVGKVTEIQHGNQGFVPVRKLSVAARLIGRILAHSNFCMRLVLKLHGPFPPMTIPPLGDVAH